ncbi:MAG: DUF4962 domain-containing protein [Phycisphaerales bacterium]|nr:DUF4962 domain-containing protein [Phycisphaerales bacterium]
MFLVTTAGPVFAEAPWALDEKPAEPGEWGFTPADQSAAEVNPPSFVWRPQASKATYDLQVATNAEFSQDLYHVQGLTLYCHCPPRTFSPGTWYWRFRAFNNKGKPSAWSSVRSFTVKPDLPVLTMPIREDLLARIPKGHPRLFMRPEQVETLRQLAGSAQEQNLNRLIRRCDELLKTPPPTAEPPQYPLDTVKLSEEWRTIWRGNRLYTITVLDAAADLAFTWLLTGNEEYGQLARRLLLDAAKWDPKGATGYRYNDEAGMPFAYLFSRTYTFLHDYLSEDDRVVCRQVMRVRGQEMYGHLAQRHLWRPYASHANRAWHFLGEIGIAFFDEIPEAADWVWFAMNVFFNVYPVWSDSDGGWHEGMGYWNSYISRFSWWADIMRAAMDIDAYRKPYFAQIGYYPLYLQPPGSYGGGFGDLSGRRKSEYNVALMSIFATQAGNPYWQWYVQAHKPRPPEGGYVGFLRGSLPEVVARPPTDLPTSRCFRGIGQAVLNTNLLDAKDNVSFLFKASPFGTQSHGYDANNAFILYAFGQPLFISSGWRDIYGSPHHSEWMWHTKSTNCITVNGESQGKRTPAARGKILDFSSTAHFDYVSGEAGAAYGDLLERFTRRVLFVKPEIIVIHDQLIAKDPAIFEWWLHSPNEMRIEGQRVMARNNQANCRVDFLHPLNLTISQTDQFDPPPRERVKLTEYHLTAATKSPDRKADFVTVLCPYKTDTQPPDDLRLQGIDGGYALNARLADGKILVLLRATEEGEIGYDQVATDAELAAVRFDAEGTIVATFRQGGTRLEVP